MPNGDNKMISVAKIASVVAKRYASTSLTKDAYRSLSQTSPELVSIRGLGRVWVEPTDEEDTFPPAIKSYHFIDGWVTYKGLRGQIGAVYGTEKELVEWMKGVDYHTSLSPPKTGKIREWVPSDGGKNLRDQAVRVATQVLRSFGTHATVKTYVNPNSKETSGSYSGSTIQLYNVHIDSGMQRYVGGATVPRHLHVAAHESAHAGYSPSKTKEVMDILEEREREGKEYITNYHALAGHFEGAMEAAAFYVLAPEKMRKTVPDVYDKVALWF